MIPLQTLIPNYLELSPAAFEECAKLLVAHGSMQARMDNEPSEREALAW